MTIEVEEETMPDYDPDLFIDEWNADLFDESDIDVDLNWDPDDTI